MLAALPGSDPWQSGGKCDSCGNSFEDPKKRGDRPKPARMRSAQEFVEKLCNLEADFWPENVTSFGCFESALGSEMACSYPSKGTFILDEFHKRLRIDSG